MIKNRIFDKLFIIFSHDFSYTENAMLKSFACIVFLPISFIIVIVFPTNAMLFVASKFTIILLLLCPVSFY